MWGNCRAQTLCDQALDLPEARSMLEEAQEPTFELRKQHKDCLRELRVLEVEMEMQRAKAQQRLLTKGGESPLTKLKPPPTSVVKEEFADASAHVSQEAADVTPPSSQTREQEAMGSPPPVARAEPASEPPPSKAEMLISKADAQAARKVDLEEQLSALESQLRERGVRMEPLGMDRHYNAYWALNCVYPQKEKDAKGDLRGQAVGRCVVMVEPGKRGGEGGAVADAKRKRGQWGVYSSEEQIRGLCR